MNLIETKEYLDFLLFHYDHFDDSVITRYLEPLVEEVKTQFTGFVDPCREFRSRINHRFNFNEIFFRRTNLPFAYMYKGNTETATLETLLETLDIVGFNYNNLEQEIIEKYMNLIIHQVRLDTITTPTYSITNEDLMAYYDSVEKDLNIIDSLEITDERKQARKDLVLIGFDHNDYTDDEIDVLYAEDLKTFNTGIFDGIPLNELIYRMREHMWHKSEAHIHKMDPTRHGRDASTNPTVVKESDVSQYNSVNDFLGTNNGSTNSYRRPWMVTAWAHDSYKLSRGQGIYGGPGDMYGKTYVGLPGNQYTPIYEHTNYFNIANVKPSAMTAIGRKDFHIPNGFIYGGNTNAVSLSTLIHDSNRYYYSEGLYRTTETIHSATGIKKEYALLTQHVDYTLTETDTYKKINHSNPIIKITSGGKARYLGTERSPDEFGYPRETVTASAQTVTTEPYASSREDIPGTHNHRSMDINPILSSGPLPKLKISNSHGSYYLSREINVFDMNVAVQVSSSVASNSIHTYPNHYGIYKDIPSNYNGNSSIELLDISVQPTSNHQVVTGITTTSVGELGHITSGIAQNVISGKKMRGFWSGNAQHDHWVAYAHIWFISGSFLSLTGQYWHTGSQNGSTASELAISRTATLAHESTGNMHIGSTGHSSHHHRGHSTHRHGGGSYYAATIYGHTSISCDAG